MTNDIEAIKHIQRLARMREKGNLLRNDNIELFDSIDSMDIEELSTLYSVVQMGLSGDGADFDSLKSRAKNLGYSLVNELFALENLGSALTKGLKAWLSKP